MIEQQSVNARALIEHIAKALVDQKDAVFIDEYEDGDETVIELEVAEAEMGKVHVVNPELEQTRALDAHAEGEALVLVGIVLDRAHHVGVDHSAAEHFGPSGMLADRASGAVAKDAMHVEFGARLGEWKITGAKTDRSRAEKRAREFGQHALEMRHRDTPAFIDHETLDLREHRRAAHRQVVAPIE